MQTISNEDMHAPAQFFLEPKDADPVAVAQAMRLCKLPFVVAAAFMSNLRPDSGVRAGTVFATDGYIVPNGLAPDIGCGLSAARTTVSAETLTTRVAGRASVLRNILDQLLRLIPAGEGPGGSHSEPQVQSLNQIDSEVLPVPGIRHPASPRLVRAKEDASRALKLAPYQLGTLGGGHHFICEVGVYVPTLAGQRHSLVSLCRAECPAR